MNDRPTTSGIPPRPSWMQSPSRTREAIVSPMILSISVGTARGYSETGRGASYSISTCPMFTVRLPRNFGSSGLISRMICFALLAAVYSHIPQPETQKSPFSSMGAAMAIKRSIGLYAVRFGMKSCRFDGMCTTAPPGTQARRVASKRCPSTVTCSRRSGICRNGTSTFRPFRSSTFSSLGTISWKRSRNVRGSHSTPEVQSCSPERIEARTSSTVVRFFSYSA